MTTPAHPQQEYIITEEQLRKYEGLFFLDEDSQEDFKKIRSRPHRSMQSRDQVLDDAIALCERDDIPDWVIIEDVLSMLKKLRAIKGEKQ